MPRRTAILLIATAALLPLSQARAQIANLHGAAGMDYGKAVAIDRDGNIYLGLYFDDTVDFDPGPAVSTRTASGFVDIAIVKYDKGGNLVWSGQITNTTLATGLADIPHAVALDGSTGLVHAGYFSGTADFDPGPGTQLMSSRGGYDMYLARWDTDGRHLWTRTLGNTNGTTEERFYDAAVGPDGTIFACGYFQGVVTPDGLTHFTSGGLQDGLVVAFDPSGAFLRGFSFGAASNDQCDAIAPDGRGGLYLLGHFGSTVDFEPGATVSNLTSAGYSDCVLARYDASNLALQWAVRLGGASLDFGAPGGLCVDADGNAVFTGRFRGSVDFDPGPGTHTLTANGANDDFLVASFSPTGTLRWAFGAGGSGGDGGHRVRVDRGGNVYVAGWFSGTCDFDPGSGVVERVSAADNPGSDLFLARYAPTGTLMWVRCGGSIAANTNDAIVAGLALDPLDRPVITGKLYGPATLASGTNFIAFAGAGDADCLLARYAQDGSIAGPDLDSMTATATGLAFRAWTQAGRTNTVEYSDDLWSWHSLAPAQVATGTTSVADGGPAPLRAYRIRATVP